MTPTVQKCYNAAVKDNDFLELIYSIDRSRPPGIFSSEEERIVFTAVYYGRLIEKYGRDFKRHI